MTLIDLTHRLDAATPVYPGDPKPELTQIATLEEDGFAAFHLSSGLQLGTHMDAPLHMVEGGAAMADVPVERFVGRGVLVAAEGASAVSAESLRGLALQAGDIVLVRTGWGARFGAPGYFDGFPEVEADFARALVRAGIAMLGLDTPSPDAPPYPVHKILLGAGIPIIENLAHLDRLPAGADFEVLAAPPRIAADGAPVRVLARLRD